MKALAIGGVFDHLHVLLSLPSTMSFAKAIQLIKAGLLNGFTRRSALRNLNGKKGMAPLVSANSQLKKTIAYINNQKEHHRKRTFKEEFLRLLDKHGIEYDPRYIFR